MLNHFVMRVGIYLVICFLSTYVWAASPMIKKEDLKKYYNDLDDIVTDRPDQTESALTIPEKTVQIETGFVVEVDDNKKENTSQLDLTINTTLLRIGILRNWEFRLNLEYAHQTRFDRLTRERAVHHGFVPVQIGTKIGIYQGEGKKPNIAFLGSLDLPLASPFFTISHPAPAFRLAIDHSILEKFGMGYNIGLEWDGEIASPTYIYTIVGGFDIYKNLGGYAEFYGGVSSHDVPDHRFNTGITYLALKNLQIDISGGVAITPQSPDGFFSLGISYRAPK